MLDDGFILHALEHSPKAWKDFWILYPSLFPCEKERFDLLFAANPYLTKQVQDEQVFSDKNMNLWNKQGIHLGGAPPLATNLPPTVLPKFPPKCKPC